VFGELIQHGRYFFLQEGEKQLKDFRAKGAYTAALDQEYLVGSQDDLSFGSSRLVIRVAKFSLMEIV